MLRLPLPGADTAAIPPSDVIIINAENSWPMVICPRLDMLGADCNRVHRINDGGNRLTLTDERIEAAIRKYNVKLTIIDPIQSHLPSSMSMGRAEVCALCLPIWRKWQRERNYTARRPRHEGERKSVAQRAWFHRHYKFSPVCHVSWAGRRA